jgi:hypothetical protein
VAKKDDKKGFLIIAAVLSGLLFFLLILNSLTSEKVSKDKNADLGVSEKQDQTDLSSFFEGKRGDYTEEELLENDPFRDVCEEAGASEDNPVLIDGTYCFR